MMCNECKIDLCTLTKADLKLKSRLKPLCGACIQTAGSGVADAAVCTYESGINQELFAGQFIGSGSSGPLIVIDFITTGVTGRSFAPVLTEAISSTTSMPSMTLPKAA